MVRKRRVIVVNQRDEVIGYKLDEDLLSTDIYRVSALWLTNSKKEVLLAQRAFSKSHDPEKWGPAVAGTIEEGETYEQNMVKEIEEELGLTGIKLKLGPKLERKTKYHYFVQWFFATLDKPANSFKIQKEEVEQVKWISKKQLTKELQPTCLAGANGIIKQKKIKPFIMKLLFTEFLYMENCP